ncbi:MAG: FadR/GntR family transcriptional regulator [Aminobacterium sp.]|jgi:GntR family transcriptional repressor for pyruvate dehydrogenase complex|uniref:FadR/GntR family transcriptional regulator n=1 Tax=unclassified Aminobacterium TaxID=2685012 RepID=UPI001BCD1E73|nr:MULTISPECIES: FadR/GntR family transcriptional regulator [unclassified Aminobacterium]MDD2206899.1 FadR/GntR family transcriptional regulator [Aminobacterium sp.]MDD3708437.1 FadR/GntR family transcriptional regulator [Aminobacterium sp.]MDD4229622.1 FadR/GntR family transcriptional regulator [Aminobacterium sp.]MDD4550980.1 FadR/GntR family transcriptional regulator [Aminobacterium sp.]MEA4877969.1 FadR/GntR family transcriptional regulator [Aminobacterium sp.]
MFKPANKATLHQNVLNQMITAIKENEWEPGSKLPGEQSLANAFEVSRNCIREVLKALELTGIVEARAGDGTYLSENALRNIANSDLVASLFEESTLMELIEARQLLEGQLAYWAAQRASDEEIMNLERILVEEPETPNVEVHYHFHNYLAEIAGNPFLLRLLDSLRTEVSAQRIVFKSWPSTELELFKKDHWEICQAIKERAPEKAQEAMIQHLLRSQNEILERNRREGRRKEV